MNNIGCCNSCNSFVCQCANVQPCSSFVGAKSCQSPFGNVETGPVVTIVDAWTVPECDSSIDVSAYGSLQVPIGTLLYNPAYGYFEITAINASIQGMSVLTLENSCNPFSQDPGYNIPAYSSFIVVADSALDTWTPALTASGSMTVSALTSAAPYFARWRVDGPFVEGDLDISFTLGGVASNILKLTMPTSIKPSTQASFSGVVGAGEVGAGYNFSYVSPTSILGIVRYDNGNFALAASRTIKGTFRYEWE